jgi:uncharacterized protein with PIN domain
MTSTFAVEKTLGKLTKWLRLIGFDVIYEGDIGAADNAAYASANRILLTRSRRVRPGPESRRHVVVQSDDPFVQLQEVVRALDIRFEDIRPFTRCILCNTPIEDVDKHTVRHLVPDYVWQNQTRFRRCRRCRKVYWPGSHIDRSMQRIKRLFQPQDPCHTHAK